MPSPYAFMVGQAGKQEVFFDPHIGPGCWCGKPHCTPTQLNALQKIARRVRFGGKPSKFFLRGNRGSGKSVVVRKGICHALAMALPGLTYVTVRRNMPDLKLNHLRFLGAEMRKLTGRDESWNKTDAQATYDNGSMGFYRQCEEEADVEKIVGAEAVILFVDEAPQIKWEYLRTISPSLRVAERADGTQPFWPVEIYCGNPMGESIEELDHYFVDKDVDLNEDPLYDPDDWELIDIHRRDNPSINEDEYLKQFAGVPAHFRAAWIDGVRMDSRTLFEVKRFKDGKPYHYISDLPQVPIRDEGTGQMRHVPVTQVPWIQVYRAFDMGFFPDPAVCVWFAVLGSRIIAVHEETWFKTPPEELAAKMIETHREVFGDIPCAMTYVDPQIGVRESSIVTVMDTLEMHGVPCEASVNDRILYADTIHGLLGTEAEPGVPKLQIYERGCPMLAKYLPKMRWDEKNPRKMGDHKFDHWPVVLAYFGISSGVLAFSQATETTREPLWMEWMREGNTKRKRRLH